MKNHKVLVIIIVILCILAPCIWILVNSNMKASKPIRVIYVLKTKDDTNSFWSALMGGAKMAAKEYDVDLEIVAPKAEEDYKRQNELIEWAIGQKPDAIVLCPADYSETTVMAKKIADNNIKLVFVDSTVNENIQNATVATDNYLAGKKMGAYMKQYIKSDTKIAIVSHVKTSSTAIEREKGLRSALGEDEKKILEVEFCDSSYQKAFDLTEEILKKHPDINMIAGLNEYSSIGVARAIKSMGLKDKIKVIGFDSSIEEIELLEEGIFQAIVIQKSLNMGYLGMEEAVNLVTGKKVDANVDSGSQLITKDNMYTEENQKLLFPFLDNKVVESE